MNGADVGIRLCAPHDRNGNPRRVLILYRDGDVVAALDEGYRGVEGTMKAEGWAAPIASEISVTPRAYHEFVAMGRILRGERICSMRKVRLNRGGYDTGGRYWGVGPTLWHITDDDKFSEYLRAPDRDSAKDKARRDFKARVR